MDEDELRQLKSVEFYAASVTAWYTSALEHDKSLFALSGGGIALLITLLTTTGIEEVATLVLFCLATTAFLVTLGCLLWVFRLNQNYIAQTLTTGSLVDDPKLKRLDQTARWSFWLGILFAAAVGFSTAWTTFNKKLSDKEKTMANDKPAPTQSVPTFDSVNGAAKLSPDFTKSFHGAGGLQPATVPSASTTGSTTTSQSSQQTSNTSSTGK